MIPCNNPIAITFSDGRSIAFDFALLTSKEIINIKLSPISIDPIEYAGIHNAFPPNKGDSITPIPTQTIVESANPTNAAPTRAINLNIIGIMFV